MINIQLYACVLLNVASYDNYMLIYSYLTFCFFLFAFCFFALFYDNLTAIRCILEQLKKACAKTAALRKLRKFIPQEVMIRLYKAYILPHLEYCSPLLLGISIGLKNKLEDTNYYILRNILNYSRAVSYDFLLNKAELQNLDNRRKFQSLVLLFKCLNGQGPQYLSEFFKVLNVNYNLRGSGTCLVLPHFNLECKHKSWSYLTTMLWNGLPAGVRGSPTLAVFKRALHSFLT